MLALLRRSRVLALVLLLVAPGVSGTALQWLHACPVNTPAAGDHHSDPQSPAHSSHGETCQCIGSCHVSALLVVGKPARLSVSYAEGRRPDATPPGTSFVPAGAPPYLLPPATAPPLS